MLHLSCHTWGFSDQPLEQAIQNIARLGFSYIDLGSGPHLDTDAASKKPIKEAQRIRELLAHFHLQINDLYLLLPALASMDEGRRLYELRLFERLIPFAVELGTPGITLSPGIAPPALEEPPTLRPAVKTPAMIENDPSEENPPGEEDAEQPPEEEQPPPEPQPIDWAIESMQQAVELIEETDLRLSFEPHMDSVAATPEQALRLLEAVPGLSLTLDWAQFTAQDYVTREIEPLLVHTAHVQLRQAAHGRLQTPYREGTIDLRQVLALLIEHDYRGALCIEYMNRSGWHGMAALDVVLETGITRNALRTFRDTLLRRQAL